MAITVRDFAGIYHDSIVVKWLPHDDNPNYSEMQEYYFKDTRDMVKAAESKEVAFPPWARVGELYFDDGWFIMDIFEEDYIEAWTYPAD